MGAFVSKSAKKQDMIQSFGFISSTSAIFMLDMLQTLKKLIK